MSVVVEADGGSRGNPGPAGYGAVVLDAETGAVLAERQGALGVTTNNVAEYQGLIAGLRAAAEVGADEVEARMDSKLVVEQMSGRWQIKNPGLRPLAAEAAALVRRFRTVRFTWVPRERNRRADALANAAMDAAAGAEEPAPAVSAPSTVSWHPPSGVATRLMLVRHGETAYTAAGKYSGRGEVSLTERGVAQARAVAGRIDGVSAVVTSPLGRCTSTAELIAQAAGNVPVRIDADLVECDFGKWEGLTFADVRRDWPAEMAAWLESASVAPPKGESFAAVSVRANRALARIRADFPGERVAVVSHVSPIKLILRDALGAGPAFLYRCYLDPAGLSIVDFWADGGVAVRAVNETAHLAGIT